MDGQASSPSPSKPTGDLKRHRPMRAVCSLSQAVDADPTAKREVPMRLVAALLAIVVSATPAYSQEIDWQKVDAALGSKPAVISGDIHRYGFPRTDLTVTLDG